MSKTVALPAREVPVLLDCDVLVVGAGTSGFAAAVAAARTGVEVVLAKITNPTPGTVRYARPRLRTVPPPASNPLKGPPHTPTHPHVAHINHKCMRIPSELSAVERIG